MGNIAISSIMSPMPLLKSFEEAPVEWSDTYKKATVLGIDVDIYVKFKRLVISRGCRCGQCQDCEYELRIGKKDGFSEEFETADTPDHLNKEERDTGHPDNPFHKWWALDRPEYSNLIIGPHTPVGHAEKLVRRMAWKIAVQGAVAEFSGDRL